MAYAIFNRLQFGLLILGIVSKGTGFKMRIWESQNLANSFKIIFLHETKMEITGATQQYSGIFLPNTNTFVNGNAGN